MNNFNSIEDIWKRQSAKQLPDADAMLAKVKKQVNQLQGTYALTNAVLIIFLLMLVVWSFVMPHTVAYTPYMLLYAVIAMVVVIVKFNKSYAALRTINYTAPPAQLLRSMQRYSISQIADYKIYYWYFTSAAGLASIVIILDFFGTGVTALACCVIWLAWVIICSTLIKRSYIRRQQLTVKNIISLLVKLDEAES